MSGLVLLSHDLFPLHLLIVFLFGAVMGSFFNVCIYRLPLGQSLNRPRRSFCPSCGTTIAWYDNIPLVSYLLLGGLCRHCGGRIAGRYWWVEFLTALLFAAAFWVHRYTVATPLFLALTAVLIIATFTDLDHWIIPDSVSLGGTAVGIAAALVLSALGTAERWSDIGRSLYVADLFRERLGPWGIAANALAGAAFGFGLLWTVGLIGTLLFRKEAMGMGDMKLFACVGAFLGWQGSLLVLALASFLGATLGLSLLATEWIVARLSRVEPQLAVQAAGTGGGESGAGESALSEHPVPALQRRPKGRQLHHLPFGPYIAVAGYIVALFYRPMTDWLMRHLFIFDLFVYR